VDETAGAHVDHWLCQIQATAVSNGAISKRKTAQARKKRRTDGENVALLHDTGHLGLSVVQNVGSAVEELVDAVAGVSGDDAESVRLDDGLDRVADLTETAW
jgi:hypothetical protein